MDTTDDSNTISPQTLSRIRESTNARYGRRYQEHGRSPRALGWGDEEQQRYRFERAFESVGFAGRTLLDIGCGFGDLCAFLQERSSGIKEYIGVDINEELVEEAKRENPSGRFFVADAENWSDIAAADIVVMLGLMNFRQAEVPNMAYARHLLRSAFACTKEVLIVDFLSEIRTPEYPKEDNMYYYNPHEVMELASELSPRFVMRHDYKPIPQREIMLIQFAEPS